MENRSLRPWLCLLLVFSATVSVISYIYLQDSHVTTQKVNVLRVNTQEKSTDPVKVLIVTYMRSGSSLVGKILQSHSKSVYAFEPLRFIEDDIAKGRSVHFLNGTERSYHNISADWILADMLYRWYTCDVGRINMKDLASILLGFSTSYRDYSRCLHITHRDQVTSVKKCLEYLQQPCQMGKLFIIKTIRLHMTSVDLLLQWLPGLKVIHLLRDPRGKLNSELKLDNFSSWSNISSRAKRLCMRMSADIKTTTRLEKQYPQNVRFLLYERFTNNPMGCTRNIFDFLNLKFTLTTRALVKKLTLYKEVRANCYWCVKKTNSKLTSIQWRTTIHMNHAQMIDNECEDIYKMAGYIQLKTYRDLRDVSVPLVKNTLLTDNSL